MKMVCLAVARSSFIHQTHKQTSKLIHTQINESMDVHKISLVCELLRIISISIINVCSHWRRHNHLSWSWMSYSRSRSLSRIQNQTIKTVSQEIELRGNKQRQKRYETICTIRVQLILCVSKRKKSIYKYNFHLSGDGY